MRPLHKKLIDQFQMMRASLYHVSGSHTCPVEPTFTCSRPIPQSKNSRSGVSGREAEPATEGWEVRVVGTISKAKCSVFSYQFTHSQRSQIWSKEHFSGHCANRVFHMQKELIHRNFFGDIFLAMNLKNKGMA